MKWLVLLILLVAACAGDAWPHRSTVFCDGPAAFCAESHTAIDAWTAALAPCPFPFVVDDNASSGHPIVLVQPEGWDCDERFAACENHARINVKGPVETGHTLQIEHEIGHAFGLPHSSTPGALMYFEGGTMHAEDVSRARAALGCKA